MSEACPKCGYERLASDTSPDYECPKCGIVYKKFGRKKEAPINAAQGEPVATADRLPLKGRKIRWLYFYAGFIFIGLALFYFSGEKGKEYLKQAKQISGVAEPEWKEYALEDSLKITLPSKPKTLESRLPPEAAKVIEKIAEYESRFGALKLSVSFTRYKEGVGPALNGIVKGSMENLEKGGDLKDFNYSSGKFSIPNAESEKFSGSFKSLGLTLSFRGIAAVHGADLWFLISIYSEGKANEEIAEKIIKSVSF